LQPGGSRPHICGQRSGWYPIGVSASSHTSLEALRISRCPFVTLPDRAEGRWGEGLTAAKVAACCWLDPIIVARIEFLERTPYNRLRHPRFAGIRSGKDAGDVIQE